MTIIVMWRTNKKSLLFHSIGEKATHKKSRWNLAFFKSKKSTTWRGKPIQYFLHLEYVESFCSKAMCMLPNIYRAMCRECLSLSTRWRVTPSNFQCKHIINSAVILSMLYNHDKLMILFRNFQRGFEVCLCFFYRRDSP